MIADTEPLDLDALEAKYQWYVSDEETAEDLHALIAEVRRLREARITERDIHDWFTSHSSKAVVRIITDGQLVIDERMADGVFE